MMTLLNYLGIKLQITLTWSISSQIPNYQLNWLILVMWKRYIQFWRFRLFLSCKRISIVLRGGKHFSNTLYPIEKYKTFLYQNKHCFQGHTTGCFNAAFGLTAFACQVSGACCLYWSIPAQGGVLSSWCVWLLFCIQFKLWNFVAFKQQPKVDYVFPSKTANFSLFWEDKRYEIGVRIKGNHQRNVKRAREQKVEWNTEITGKIFLLCISCFQSG